MVSIALLYRAQASPPLNKEERKKAIEWLQTSQKELNSTLKGLSNEQLNYKQDESTWSIADVLEHITASEDGLSSAAVGILQRGSQTKPDKTMSDDMLLSIITSREQKVKTRPDLNPTNRYGGYEETKIAFQKKRAENIAFIKKTDLDMRDAYFQFPFGHADTYQVMLFIAGHTKRHVDQMKEIMAADGFPKL